MIPQSAAGVEALCAAWIAGPKTDRAARMPPRAAWHALKELDRYPVPAWARTEAARLPGEAHAVTTNGTVTVSGFAL